MKNISRRSFINRSSKTAAGLVTGAIALQNQSCGGRKADDIQPSQPNIIVIVADDAGWNDVGYHGSEIKTPNIDRLTREGVELDSFYAYPVCSPTRAALLTGRPPSRFGILGPIAMKSTQALPQDSATLPEMLRRGGYETSITGKWHLGLRPEVGPGKYGFDHTYGYLHGQIDQETHIYKNGDRSWHKNEEFIDEDGHATDLITDEAIRIIQNRKSESKPFFLYVPYSVPHYPLQEDAKWVDPYKDSIDNESRRIFAASMTHMDDAIGRITGALQDEGIDKDTLVIFFSDNGGQDEWTPTFEYDGKFTKNDRLGDNRPLKGWKGQLYEGGIRVPAFMHWPGTLKPGKVTDPMYVCDIYPTLAHLAETAVPEETIVEGENVWESVTGTGSPIDRIFYWRSSSQLAIRNGDWKLVHNGGTLDDGGDELYSIIDDPLETTDIAAGNPAVVAELLEILKVQFASDL